MARVNYLFNLGDENMDITEKCKEILIGYKNIIFAYIFGSFVQDKIRKDSDIDIAIYLDKKMDLETFIDVKMNLTEACKREVDLIILNDAAPLLKHEICKNNILLFTRDESLETNFKVKTLFEFDDMKRYLDLAYKSNIDRLKKEMESNG